ncbi:2-oxoacid:acceptor oxidoreductase subunit alpha [Flavobacteriales bacterium]|nr:2-oxoacid:acceptor oxidoreductase subunit alpha [Flavobacteriales bacterium]
MVQAQEQKKTVTILFAGDSGDGMQLTGSQFTNTNALFGNDVSTFPDFPAEIRAPQGTIAGVSGFQLNFGSIDVFTPGDSADVLVAMNAAALKASLHKLKIGGAIIVNTSGFDGKNLRLAGYDKEENPLTDNSLGKYRVLEMDVTKLTRACLKDSGMSVKHIDRSKNMFVLGVLYWMYNRELKTTIEFIETKFSGKEDLIDANIKVLKAGYYFGDTSEIFTSRYEVKPAPLSRGIYRNIMGNQATAIGLIAAAKKAKLELFYGSYPITPASDVLHELAKHKNFGVKTYQAEDEIAAVCAAIGASFGGSLGVTASSGPGIALKGEALGLAMILELPLVIVNVQRGGPSTGLPTKTEQADLLQALYGRNGEAPIPVVAPCSPSDCFDTVYEAARIAVEHMTPVFFLSDGYIANGSEPWNFPSSADMVPIKVQRPEGMESDQKFKPYTRDEKGVRPWAIPGVKGLEHRVGGLEKENETGNVSYDPENHEMMVKLRAKKVADIANHIPKQQIELGKETGEVLVLGWGSSFGANKTAVKELINEGYSVSQAHVRYLNPLPLNLGDLIAQFDKVLIPEINDGQFVKLVRDEFLVDAIPLNKIKGVPFSSEEIKNKVLEIVKG